MKISKLFHWLYAILMLLPAFAIGLTCAVAVFNENAYTPTYEINYKYETNKVTGSQDIIVGNIYHVHLVKNDTNTYFGYQYTDILNISTDGTNRYDYLNNLTANPNIYGVLYGQTNSVLHVGWFPYRDINVENGYRVAEDWTYFDADIVFAGYVAQYGTYWQGLGECTNIPFNNVIDNPNNTYNVFYYSIDKVQQSPLFNWAYDSFLATPITYITGLFGIASDHISVMLMSYWLAISVIWLVFDMVMYVPLLVHRWIDKGVLE